MYKNNKLSVLVALLLFFGMGCSSPFQREYKNFGSASLKHPNETTQIALSDVKLDSYQIATIQTAVDECARAIKRDSVIGSALLDGEGILQAATAVITFPESTVVSILSAFAKPFGGATSTPPPPSLTNDEVTELWTAGKAFVANNAPIERNVRYYSGLYNAVGSVCPYNGQLIGGFKFEKSKQEIYSPKSNE
ncbi:hypothetical protein KEF85_04780 [Methylomonas paludis]|uniref:Lipoprotein n=1 Tax=Methylomonas paludis TaxID=1173101 RepID=A0A975MPS8_9GAMM|nr:hypothetical protein [Methylomonas paludis]QWF71791.1 hypothetical protein KEF85_04780 [Methylomonas paludis]